MKSHVSMWLLCYVLSLATACKKELNSSVTDSSSAMLLNEQQYNPQEFRAANFSIMKAIDNPWLPLFPGTVFRYINTINEDGKTSHEHIQVTVTSDIKKILGVNCEVVHDQVKENGEVTEDTYDWYAQDVFGNVWYFGEYTQALTDTGWSTEGSWEAGVQGALPGIVMFADPGLFIGTTYHQEFLQGVAEDEARVINITSNATVAYGHFTNCVKTKEFTRLTAGDIEFKFYAKDIGQVLTKSETEREELISITKN